MIGVVQVSEESVAIPTAKFDVILEIFDTGDSADGLKCYWEYATDLFDAATIERLTQHFETLLQGIVNRSVDRSVDRAQQKISLLPLLTEAERRQLLMEWNLVEWNHT